jgi:hypothetical protein
MTGDPSAPLHWESRDEGLRRTVCALRQFFAVAGRTGSRLGFCPSRLPARPSHGIVLLSHPKLFHEPVSCYIHTSASSHNHQSVLPPRFEAPRAFVPLSPHLQRHHIAAPLPPLNTNSWSVAIVSLRSHREWLAYIHPLFTPQSFILPSPIAPHLA